MGLIFIKEYKGFDIEFDPDKEKFTASGNAYDTEFVKPSISALKKTINDFNKENANFGEFKIQGKDISYKAIPEVYTVIGTTADKKLRYKDSEGKIFTISKYDLEKYILFKESNQPIFQEQLDIQTERNKIEREYNARIREVGEKIKATTLAEYVKSAGLDIDTSRW